MADSTSYLLAPEDLTQVLSSIQLLSAMWSGTDELWLDANSETTIRLVADYLSLPVGELGSDRAQKIKDGLGEEVVMGLRVGANAGEEVGAVWVNVGFALGRRANQQEGGVKMWTSAKDAPTWLSRNNVEVVNHMLSSAPEQEAEQEAEDMVGRMLTAIERVSEFVSPLSRPPPRRLQPLFAYLHPPGFDEHGTTSPPCPRHPSAKISFLMPRHFRLFP